MPKLLPVVIRQKSTIRKEKCTTHWYSPYKEEAAIIAQNTREKQHLQRNKKNGGHGQFLGSYGWLPGRICISENE